MPFIFAVVLSFILNFIVHVYCKDFNHKEILLTSLKEEANFEKLVRMKTRENKEDEDLIKPITTTFVRKNFIPLEDLNKLKRVKTVEDFRREFRHPLREDYLLRRGMNDEQPQQFENALCEPRLTAIEIPPPARGLYFPSFILLHRCTGGCAFVRSDIHHCVATATKEIKVLVTHVSYRRKRRRRSIRGLPWEAKRTNVKRQVTEVVVPVVNHTKCDCKCVVKASDCKNDTQDYDAENCRCNCKDLSHICNTTFQTWDNENCRCKCRKNPFSCDSSSKLWSPDTCKCECLDKIRKRCMRKNKLLNTQTCSCYCSPKITCPKGKQLDSSDCRCV